MKIGSTALRLAERIYSTLWVEAFELPGKLGSPKQSPQRLLGALTELAGGAEAVGQTLVMQEYTPCIASIVLRAERAEEAGATWVAPATWVVSPASGGGVSVAAVARMSYREENYGLGTRPLYASCRGTTYVSELDGFHLGEAIELVAALTLAVWGRISYHSSGSWPNMGGGRRPLSEWVAPYGDGATHELVGRALKIIESPEETRSAEEWVSLLEAVLGLEM
ncbi:MAG: hypothetical protein ACOX0G_01730 [Patescibacteria group bacterium]|mgnify:CR=1 FL=1|jgi:hypothetical protein